MCSSSLQSHLTFVAGSSRIARIFGRCGDEFGFGGFPAAASLASRIWEAPGLAELPKVRALVTEPCPGTSSRFRGVDYRVKDLASIGGGGQTEIPVLAGVQQGRCLIGTGVEESHARFLRLPMAGHEVHAV